MYKIILTVAISLLSIHVSAQHKVGRVALSLPEPNQWVLLAEGQDPMAYTGDVSGDHKAQTKVFGLIRNTMLEAVLYVNASYSGLQLRFSYSQGCKPYNREYVFDSSRGKIGGLDCLRVWHNINAGTVLKDISPKAFEAAIEKGYAIPPLMHSISHEVGTDNATFIYTELLVVDERLSKVAANQNSNLIENDSAVMWGQQLSKAARRSVNSLLGRMELPRLD
jgi:hypothetical protein